MVSGADLFVATGSQYMTDIAKEDAIQVLDRLEVAAKQGIPTAMVGQGMGPITDPESSARAKDVLPMVDLIFVRGKIGGSQDFAVLWCRSYQSKCYR